MNIDNISKSLNQIIDDNTSDNIKLGEALNDLEYEGVEGSILTTLNNKQNKSDSSLATTDKTIVGAINELFQNVDSGKQLIADAIDDEAITKDSTFEAMSNAISAIKDLYKEDALKKLLQKENFTVTDSMSINDMISMLPDPEDMDSSLSEEEKLRYKLYDFLVSYKYEVTDDMSKDQMLDYIIKDALSNWISTLKKLSKDSKFLVLGAYATYILKNDGTLWACGRNDYGQLGLGDTTNRNTFTQVASNVKSVHTRYAYHVVIVKNDNTVWTCGYNKYGQLGLGDTTNRSTFTQIPSLTASDIEKIETGYYVTAIIKKDGTLWVCGYNSYGQLGLGDTTDRSTLTQITNISDVQDFSIGCAHCLIVTKNGALYSAGKNEYGELGVEFGVSPQSKTPICAKQSGVKFAVAGYYNSIIIDTDNNAYASGWNSGGCLGDVDTECVLDLIPVISGLNIKKISMGDYFTIVITEEGDLYIAGYSEYFYPPTLPDTLSEVSETSMSSEDDQTDENNIQSRTGVGPTSYFEYYTFTLVSHNVKDAIADGTTYVYVIDINDGIWRCGSNSYGQLSTGGTTYMINLTKLDFEL